MRMIHVLTASAMLALALAGCTPSKPGTAAAEPENLSRVTNEDQTNKGTDTVTTTDDQTNKGTDTVTTTDDQTNKGTDTVTTTDDQTNKGTDTVVEDSSK